jgi:predicted AlkP superfamily phosphohydrolase/phosphomutase
MKLALRNDPKRIEVANYLLEQYEPDLFVFITRIPDVMTHFTTNLRKIRLTYEVIDSNLGKLIDQAEMKNYSVIIVSDHGTGRQVNRRFCANNWLENYGFLKKVPKETSKSHRFLSTAVNNLTEFLRSKGLSPLLRSLLGYIEEKIGRRASASTFDVSEELIQWENTKAFAYEGGGTNFTGIKILLNNRSSQTTSSDEYEDLRRNLCQKLKHYQDPRTGVNVVEEIFLREQIFQGTNIHLMPDIVLKLNEKYVAANLTSFSASSILSSDKELIHTENGVFIASGPIFEKGLSMEDANIVDVTPTILHILNIPIPKDMDGKVLQSIFNKDSGLLDKEVEYSEPKIIEEGYQITQREKKEIREKLRALGYL